MEDPSIIPTHSHQLRADAEPFIPKGMMEIPKKVSEMPKGVVHPIISKPHISMRQRVAFRDLSLLLESLHMCKKDTGQVDRALILLNIFASLLTKEVTSTIVEALEQIKHQSFMIRESQMRGSTGLMMHLHQFTMLVEELYGFMTRLNAIVF